MTNEEQAIQKALKETIDSSLSQFHKDVVEKSINKANEGNLTKKDIEDLNSQLDARFEKLSEADAKIAKSLEDQLAKISLNSNTAGRLKSTEEVINEAVKAYGFDDLPSAVKGSKREFEFQLQKADQVMSSLGSGVIIPQRTTQEIIRAPFAPFHMSDLVDRGGSTNVNSISYTKEASYTNGMGYVLETVEPSQTNQTFSEITDQTKKIGTIEIMSDEILRNMPRLLSYLIPTLREKLEIFKDNAILNGTNAGGQIRGLRPSAQTFGYSAGLGKKVKTPTILDLIVKASLMATNIYHRPNAVLMHPSDFSDLILAKSTTGEYVIDGTMLISNNYVIPILTHPIIAQGGFLIGDFAKAAEWFTFVAPTIRFSDQQLFSSGKVIAKIETEGAMQITQPDAFVNIPVISTALTAIDVDAV